jgi:hypothetical protein
VGCQKSACSGRILGRWFDLGHGTDMISTHVCRAGVPAAGDRAVLARAAGPVVVGQGRGDTRAAARSGRATPHDPEAAYVLGRPGRARRAHQAHAGVLSEYIGHYNTGRSHQGDGMGLRAPDDDPDIIAFPVPATQIQRRARLAGLINEYRQAA